MLEQFLPAAPLMVVLIGAIIGVILEGALPRHIRASVQTAWTLLVLLAALGWSVIKWSEGVSELIALGAVALDGPTWISWILLLSFAALAALLFAERQVSGGDSPFAASAAAVPASTAEREAIAARQEHSEVFPLLLFSLTGMMIFAAASDFITMFVALEVFSFPLYILSGMARRRRLLSQEAALKYFLLGALSSALFLYGVALLYGYSGSFQFRIVDAAIAANLQSPWLLLAGLALVAVGVLFKLGAVPFHHWVPDVYYGAPTAVTGFMAVCTKIAAAAGLLRILYVALGAMRWDWQLAIAVIAVLTMAVGAVIGLVQTNVKRVLAYSSIAHAGFILVGVAGAGSIANQLAQGRVGSVAAVMIYLAAYGFATMGAFAIITTVRRGGFEETGYQAWAGMGRKNPLLGLAMTFFLLSMAGIPLTGGFIGKLVVFIAGWQGGYSWLVLLAVLFSLVTAAFYFRIIWIIFGQPPADQIAVIEPGVGTKVVVWLGVIATFILGIIPGPIMTLLVNSAGFLR